MQGSPLHPQAAGFGAARSERATANTEITRTRSIEDLQSHPAGDPTPPPPRRASPAELHFERAADRWIVRNRPRGRIVAILYGVDALSMAEYRTVFVEIAHFVAPEYVA